MLTKEIRERSYEKLQIENSQLNARAEALERAAAQICYLSCVNSKTEWTCEQPRCVNADKQMIPNNPNPICRNWKFDQSRFTENVL